MIQVDFQAQKYRHARFAYAPVLFVHSKILTAANLFVENGAHDPRMMNSKVARDTVQGAGTDYINEDMISEEDHYAMGQTIRIPTDRFSGGQHISQL